MSCVRALMADVDSRSAEMEIYAEALRKIQGGAADV
jgi:hypothetical protein